MNQDRTIRVVGTPADFYTGIRQRQARLGSVTFDGYPNGMETDVLTGLYTTAQEWQHAVTAELDARRESYSSEDPWPWPDSSRTDWVYTWHDGKLYTAGAHCWVPLSAAIAMDEVDVEWRYVTSTGWWRCYWSYYGVGAVISST